MKGTPWKQFIYPCPPFTTPPLSCPSKSPVFRLPAPLPLPPPTAKVFKAAKDATPPDRENLELDFMSEVIENNNDARSDHGGGEAAHRQPLKERANKTSPKENPWNQSNCPRPPFNMSTLTCPYETPVFRLPAPPSPSSTNRQLSPTGQGKTRSRLQD